MTDAPLDTTQRAAELDKLENVVGADLGAGVHSDVELLQKLSQYAPIAAPSATEDDLEHLARRMSERLNIDVQLGVSVVAQDFEPWLEDYRRRIEWPRWLAYKQFLLNTIRSPLVLDKMDELTDTILEYVGNPHAAGSWQRRGLILGDVQSGKTATYLGLFNKAADVGYRLIIVLAGQTESLRRQTQSRVDEGVIGRDSVRAPRRGPSKAHSATRYIGVGALRRDLANAIGMTTVTTDFRLKSLEATNQTLGQNPHAPYVFVLKKNKSVLAAVFEWLDTQRSGSSKLQVPLLLLDDEADYASINTREENDPTATNQAIRDILALFDRASYIGFTATPFANIFIDHTHDEDLFPRDYIYGLESPSNYVGAERMFGQDRASDRNLIYLDDAADIFPAKHKSTQVVEDLPPSLKEAIRAFLLANAIRDLKGQMDQPRAMLVNVSRFTDVQAQVHELVQAELVGLKNAVEFHTASYQDGEDNPDIRGLESTFASQYSGQDVPWNTVLEALPLAIRDLRAKLVNSKTDRSLMDSELADATPARQIAVGGDVLSRGLTLEGLTISYFYRHVQASDTLMQMARWFGYRDGYEDLCRIWIDRDAAAGFEFAADSVSDLRSELRFMHQAKLTPKDFGLAVQKHPGALLITARNKSLAAKTGTARISLRTRTIESPKLPGSAAELEKNWASAQQLVRLIEAGSFDRRQTDRQNVIWQDLPRDWIADFLSSYQAHSSNALFAPQLSRFVATTAAEDLQRWDVILMSGSGAPSRLGGEVFNQPQRRASVDIHDHSVRVSGDSMRVAGREDIAQALTDKTYREVVDEWRRTHEKTVPEGEFARRLVRPLLLLYPIEPKQPDGHIASLGLTCPILAVKLALPRGDASGAEGRPEDEVQYLINTVAQSQWYTEFSGGDDDGDLVG